MNEKRSLVFSIPLSHDAACNDEFSSFATFSDVKIAKTKPTVESSERIMIKITYIEDRGIRGILRAILKFSLYLLWSPEVG